ncbi:MAG: DNA polymerase III subunit delta [Cyclobacteriaceae bacterium]|nr:DNA polymerase III subunit delta [Cyclobacteriaceae bacterium]
MRFADIPGLTNLKTKLIDSVKHNHIAHAQLFVGKPGALNLPLALAYATYLHCQNRGEHDACGTCPACSKNLKYIHPDTSFVFPFRAIKSDEDPEKVKADNFKTWRTFLTQQPFDDLAGWINQFDGDLKQASILADTAREIIKTLSLKPFESKYKVMVIWQPELMNIAAANSILKILEEPPANTFFLLVSNAGERLLATIQSRTQAVQVPLLADEDLDQYLQTEHKITESRRQEIIQLADGNLNQALKLISSDEDHFTDKFADWMRACFKRDYGRLVTTADDFHDLEKLDQRNFLIYGLSMLRETLLHCSGAAAISRLKNSESQFVKDFSKVMTVDKIERIQNLLNDAHYYIERYGSAKMILLDLSLQVSTILNPINKA